MSFANSQSEQREFNCPNCQKNFKKEVWVLIDLDSTDLLNRIYSGKLHTFECPHCGVTSNWNFSFMVYDPGDRDFMFVTDANADDEQKKSDMVHLAELGQRLWLELGEKGKTTLYVMSPTELHEFIEDSMDGRDELLDGFEKHLETIRAVLDDDPDGRLQKNPEVVKEAISAIDEMIADATAERDKTTTIEGLQQMRGILIGYKGE